MQFAVIPSNNKGTATPRPWRFQQQTKISRNQWETASKFLVCASQRVHSRHVQLRLTLLALLRRRCSFTSSSCWPSPWGAGNSIDCDTLVWKLILWCHCLHRDPENLTKLSNRSRLKREELGLSQSGGARINQLSSEFGPFFPRKEANQFWTVGRAAKCRQKVCSSKRPPKLEPKSVRPKEVFENLACRICHE